MSRHFVVTFILATLASLTVLVLASTGVMDPLGAWLFDQYLAEGLIKESAARAGMLPFFSVVFTAFAVGWVTVEAGPAGPKLAIAAVAALLWGFLSLTLTLYGIFFDPFAPMAASVLVSLTGLCVAETPRGRRARDMSVWFGSRVSTKTLRELLASEWRPDSAPFSRELAVVVCRILEPPSDGDAAREYLEAARGLIDEAADFLRIRTGVVLDLPEADSLRALFGMVPERAANAVSDACAAALDLKRCLREFADLNKQAARPSVNFGIGVSAGPMLLGLHSGRFQAVATATGAPADHARHLAGLTARHQATILLGRRAAQLAREHFELRTLDGEALHALAGRREPAVDESITIEEPAPQEGSPPPPAVLAAAPRRLDHEVSQPTAGSSVTTLTVTETPIDEIVVPETSIDPFPVHPDHAEALHKPRVVHKKRPKSGESADQKAG